MEYKPNLSEEDPRALFQQQIPKSFLELNEKLNKYRAESSQDQSKVMEYRDFSRHFMDLFEDEDEFKEAVYFHKTQGKF